MQKKLSTLFIRICIVWMVSVSATLCANTLEGIRVWPSPEETRVVIDLEKEVTFTYFTLTRPDRLVLDLKQTHAVGKKPALPIRVKKKSSILKLVRSSRSPTKGTLRLVFELKKKTHPRLFKLQPTPGGRYGHRLVIDIPHSAKKIIPAAAKPIYKPKLKQSKLIDAVIAIDAGHGGDDPGSIGPTKKYEKNTTLIIARKIAERLNRVEGLKTVLTRSGDYYVNLNKRSELARKHKAHLLISIHADSFVTSQPKGASVFVLNTRRANTEIARWVEKHEEQSELLGGAGEALENSRDKNISQTLLDLQFSHSQKEGHKLAIEILKSLGKVTWLHKRKPVYASLAVLKSPDIPSVLVETGFISNPIEERLLFQTRHQNKIASAVARAVEQYLVANPPPGTKLSQPLRSDQHRVKRGESLSAIAQHYGKSVDALVKANHLKTTQIEIGQVLTIPKYKQYGNEHIFSYRVKKGDFLSRIAQHFHTSTTTIKKYNHLRSNGLEVGQLLKIPVKSTYVTTQRHRVKRGEFLSKIANRYGVSVADIVANNRLRSKELAIGQVLKIETLKK